MTQYESTYQQGMCWWRELGCRFSRWRTFAARRQHSRQSERRVLGLLHCIANIDPVNIDTNLYWHHIYFRWRTSCRGPGDPACKRRYQRPRKLSQHVRSDHSGLRSCAQKSQYPVASRIAHVIETNSTPRRAIMRELTRTLAVVGWYK